MKARKNYSYCKNTMTNAPSTPASNIVDAVVTWVDGTDPIHIQKRIFALGKPENTSPSTIPAGVDQTRFENNNEIEYCLRSIRRFAPWVRTIFLVTDKQRPRFLTENERLKLGIQIIDHHQLFVGHEEVLPTFNSLSIETVLHRIPGLAEQHLYFNDDFILMAPTHIEDFFSVNGVVLRGKWEPLHTYGPVRLLLSKILNRVLKALLGINRAMSVLQQMRGASLAGASKRYYKVGHIPYPMRKTTVGVFFADHPQAFTKNIAYRFRNLNQYAVTALANHLEITGRYADLRPADDALMLCFNRDSHDQIQQKLQRLHRNDNVRFLCIQSLEQASETDRAALLKSIQKMLL